MRSFTRRFARLLLFTIFALLVSAGLAVFVARSFDVEKIEVTGAHVAVTIDEKKLYKNLLFFPVQKIRSQILGDNPLLKDVQIRKKFPHTLLIIMSERVPIARIVTAGHEYLTDGDGFIVGIVSPADTSLALISFPTDPVSVGTKIRDTGILDVLKFIGAVRLHVLRVNRLDSTSFSAQTQETDIYFTQTADIQGKVSTLQTIIAGFRIKGTLPKIIDLRFDKPVVTF